MTAITQPKIWTREDVLALLDRSDKAVVSALKTLFARQTSAEQQEQRTVERNGRGFNARDAVILTDIAQRLPRYGDRMTERQLQLVRGRIRKYVGQLLEEIEAKGGLVEHKPAKPDRSVTSDERPLPVPARAVETNNAETERAAFGAWA